MKEKNQERLSQWAIAAKKAYGILLFSYVLLVLSYLTVMGLEIDDEPIGKMLERSVTVLTPFAVVAFRQFFQRLSNIKE